MPCYWPTKKSGKGIFIRMKAPKCLKSHCEFTMTQKSRQQGCKLITGGVPPETTQLRGRCQITETVMLVPCDNILSNSSSKQTNVQIHCPLALKQFYLVMWGSPKRHLPLFLFCWPKWMKKSGEPGSQPGPVRPSMLPGLLRAISYGNQCGRMQSIAKQVTLAPTAPHKTVKTQGYLAVTLEWRLKRRLNRGENKAAL